MQRRFLILAGLAVLIIATVVLLPRLERTPTYQGKDVYTLMFEQPSSALESSPGFMAIGSNAVPYLARALAMDKTLFDTYAWVRKPGFQRFAEKSHLDFTWRKSAQQVRHAAAFSLLAFDFEAIPALSQLHAELLRATEQDRQNIVHCLSALGPPPASIPWLVKAFPLTTNESYVVRHDLLHALGRAGTNAAKMALPIAIACLDDKNWDVRIMAAETIDRWGQPAPEALLPLLSLLRSTNESAAISAASAIGRITNRCEGAVTALRHLQPTNYYARATVAISLWRLGGDADETRTALEALLKTKEGRGFAARYLGQMGSTAQKAVPALLEASQKTLGTWVDPWDRAQCAKAVLKIHGGSPEAYTVLEESITTVDNYWVRETMIDEIAQLGPLAKPLLPALRIAVQGPKRKVRHAAGLALSQLSLEEDH